MEVVGERKVWENTQEVLNVEESGWMAQRRQRGAEEKSSEAGDGVYMKAGTGWAQAPLQFHLQPQSPPLSLKKASLCFPPQWPPLPR